MSDQTVTAPQTPRIRSAWDTPLSQVLRGVAPLILAVSFIPIMPAEAVKPLAYFGAALFALGLLLGLVSSVICAAHAAAHAREDDDDTVFDRYLAEKERYEMKTMPRFTLLVAGLFAVFIVTHSDGAVTMGALWFIAGLLGFVGVRATFLSIRKWVTR